MISKKELQEDIKTLSNIVEYAIKNGGNNYKLVDERLRKLEDKNLRQGDDIRFLKDENGALHVDFASIRKDIYGLLGYLKIRRAQKIVPHNTPFEKIPAKRRKK